MKKIILMAIAICLSLIFSGCKNDVVESKETSQTYSFHKSIGCNEDTSLLENGDPNKLYWEYSNGNLRLQIVMNLYCDTILSHEITREHDTIIINLKDTDEELAKCICEMQEIFEFDVTGDEDIRVIVKYQDYSWEKSQTLIDETLDIN